MRIPTLSLVLLALAGCNGTALVESKDPIEKNISISGKIDTELTYSIKVEYKTHSENNKCNIYGISAGRWLAQEAFVEYKPTIKNGQHNLIIPLSHYSDKTECNWLPTTVFIDIKLKNNDRYEFITGSMFLMLNQGHDGNKVIDYECYKSLRGESKYYICNRIPFKLHSENVSKFNEHYIVNIRLNNDK